MTKVKLVKQGSGVYTITIPKVLVELNKWENSEFEMELVSGSIILKKVKK